MRFTQFLTAGALVALATAQTQTDCNPTEKDCPNDPAMAKTFDTDFRQGATSVEGWNLTSGALEYTSEGAQFTIKKQKDSPTIKSKTYLHFGRVEIKMKAAPGQGIISSIVLQSEDLDEVDWEFLGGVTGTVQTNYFGKGNTTVYDRMMEFPVNSNVQTAMHTYALDWTAERIEFSIDNNVVRTLKYADANGGKNYPQTPSTVRLGIWAGGDPDNNAGTIEWAGGKTDYSKAPFTMTVESVKCINYSPGKEYEWTDKTGDYKSIKVIGAGDESGAPQNTAPIEPSATATGDGLQSGINAPSGTAVPTVIPSGTAPAGSGSPSQPQASTTCTEGQGHETSYPTPSAPSSGNHTVPANPEESPCSCGIATVTVTGPSPPPVETPTTLLSSSSPDASSAIPPPPVTVPASSAPPYPTNPGIVTDTNPAPSVPIPTGGVTAPPANATTSAPAEFPGAASNNKVGALAIFVGAAAVLLI